MKPPTSGRRINLVASVMGGITCLGFLAGMVSNRDISHHSRVIEALEEAKIANHDLNENTLRLRTFMLNSYDPLVRDVARLRLGCKKMSGTAEFADLRTPRSAQRLAEYCSAVNLKADRIEAYKTQHAILSNSLRYMPILNAQFEATGYERDADSVLSDVMLFNLQPAPELQAKVERQLKQLDKRKARAPIRDLMQALQYHSRAIVRQSATRRDLEEQILAPDLSRRLEEVEQAYMEGYQRQQRRALVYHYALVILCLGLGGWLVHVFKRLEQARQHLADMNASLENKVELRTVELSETMKKLAENQQLLMQSTKMTALGEMAGGIAHEINTPLAAILLNVGAVLDSLDPADTGPNRRRLDNILKIVERVSKIILGLKRFSRNSSLEEKTDTPLSLIIDDTLTLCTEKMRAKGVGVEVKMDDQAMTLSCVPEQISQVLLNFLNNSMDALDELPPDTGRWIRIAALDLGGQLELSVTDAGPGLPAAVRQKIMQPFFTTKAVGVGTGLGLSISKGIVEQHGGRLYYDDACPNTRFVMQFPHKNAA